MKFSELDDTDRKILRILQEDSTLTVKELAIRVNLSTSPTFDRQKRLEREGFIQGYHAIVDAKKTEHAPETPLADAHGRLHAGHTEHRRDYGVL